MQWKGMRSSPASVANSGSSTDSLAAPRSVSPERTIVTTQSRVDLIYMWKREMALQLLRWTYEAAGKNRRQISSLLSHRRRRLTDLSIQEFRLAVEPDMDPPRRGLAAIIARTLDAVCSSGPLPASENRRIRATGGLFNPTRHEALTYLQVLLVQFLRHSHGIGQELATILLWVLRGAGLWASQAHILEFLPANARLQYWQMHDREVMLRRRYEGTPLDP